MEMMLDHRSCHVCVIEFVDQEINNSTLIYMVSLASYLKRKPAKTLWYF
jgi:hypothetical protein